MSRYLDFSEMVAKETVAELQQPGSGIGKFGDYAHKYLIVHPQNPGDASLFEEVKQSQQQLGAPKKVLDDTSDKVSVPSDAYESQLIAAQSLIDLQKKTVGDAIAKEKELNDKISQLEAEIAQLKSGVQATHLKVADVA